MKIKTVKEICTTIAKNNNLTLEKNQKITFGFKELDNLLGNNYLGKENLICLTAKPGFGKSTLALDFILNVAKTSKKEVIYFTSQSNSEQIINKLIQKFSGLILDNNAIQEKEETVLFNTLNELYNLNLTIINFTDKICEIIEEMLEIKREISLIVIDDYNDLISFEQNALIKLKVLSKCFNIPILLCGNLVSKPNITKNLKPNLSDLGKKARYFDIVLFLHRDAYYLDCDDDYNPNSSELIVAKNNIGNTGIVNLFFDYKAISFYEYKIENF
ncbi:MAG: hypothetical protein E7524_03405 [Ruminococcaceae bacterium]|nr:hypothetical protein [Oscillospiraceae bacterium]